MTPAGNSQNNKELVDRVKDLELQFKQHVSESKAEKEDQYEKIVILKAARKAQEEKFKLVFNEMEVLKAQNRDNMARIVQMEEILQTKIATSPIQSSAIAKPNDNDGTTIPSSCDDLKHSGHHLNGIYMVFDANVKKVLATYCDFRQFSTSVGSRSIRSIFRITWNLYQNKKTLLNIFIFFIYLLKNQAALSRK